MEKIKTDQNAPAQLRAETSIDENPDSSGALAVAPCSADGEDPLNVWGWPEPMCLKVNLNCPTITADSNGNLVQISPNNWETLVPKGVIVEFFDGKEASQETIDRLWDLARTNHKM